MSELPNDQSSGYQNDDKSPMKDDGMDSFTQASQSAARKKKKPSSGHMKAKGNNTLNNKNQKKMKPPGIKSTAEEVVGP